MADLTEGELTEGLECFLLAMGSLWCVSVTDIEYVSNGYELLRI